MHNTPVMPSPSFSSLALRRLSSMPSSSLSRTLSRPRLNSSSTRSRSSSQAIRTPSCAYSSSLVNWASSADRSNEMGYNRRRYSCDSCGRIDSCFAVSWNICIESAICRTLATKSGFTLSDNCNRHFLTYSSRLSVISLPSFPAISLLRLSFLCSSPEQGKRQRLDHGEVTIILPCIREDANALNEIFASAFVLWASAPAVGRCR